jgi:putative porin
LTRSKRVYSPLRFLAAAFFLPAGIGLAQEAEFFQPPSQKPKLVFRWDALARYDLIDHLHFRDTIERLRLEARPELDLEFSDRLRIGVRAVGDLGTDHNEDNARNFDNYRSRGAAIERYYVEAKPGQFALRAGAFGMPLVASEMIWDRDIQTPGMAAAWEIPVRPGSTLTVAGAGFYGPQREGDQTRIGVGQLVFRTGDPERIALEAAGSYWHFRPDDLKPSYFRQNYTTVIGGARELLSRFRIVDAIVRLRFPVGKLPVSLGFDGAVNLGVAEEAKHEKSAFEAVASVGRLGNPGDWRVFYIYEYVERDAVLGAYNTDDWWFHSWHRGSRVGIGVTVLPQVFVQATAVFQKRLDLKTTLNRVVVDLAKLF